MDCQSRSHHGRPFPSSASTRRSCTGENLTSWRQHLTSTATHQVVQFQWPATSRSPFAVFGLGCSRDLFNFFFTTDAKHLNLDGSQSTETGTNPHSWKMKTDSSYRLSQLKLSLSSVIFRQINFWHFCSFVSNSWRISAMPRSFTCHFHFPQLTWPVITRPLHHFGAPVLLVHVWTCTLAFQCRGKAGTSARQGQPSTNRCWRKRSTETGRTCTIWCLEKYLGSFDKLKYIWIPLSVGKFWPSIQREASSSAVKSSVYRSWIFRTICFNQCLIFLVWTSATELLWLLQQSRAVEQRPELRKSSPQEQDFYPSWKFFATTSESFWRRLDDDCPTRLDQRGTTMPWLPVHVRILLCRQGPWETIIKGRPLLIKIKDQQRSIGRGPEGVDLFPLHSTWQEVSSGDLGHHEPDRSV